MESEFYINGFYIGVIILFVFIEHFSEKSFTSFSHGGVDRRKHLLTDVISFAVLLLSSKLWRELFSVFSAGPSWETLRNTSLCLILSNLNPFLKVMLVLLCGDFILYWIHRILHLSILWRVHAWHHSTEHLYWFSGFRASVLHTLIYLFPQLIIVFGVFQLNIPQSILVFSIGAFVQLFSHTSTRISLGWLDSVIVTPGFHRIHHGKENREGWNFRALFVFWDRMFATYKKPSNNPINLLGLSEEFSVRQIYRMMIGV